MTPLINVKDLNVAYHEKPALWHVNMSIQENSRTAIVGPNGAGKSTLIKSIMKLIRPVSGKIEIEGRDARHALKHVAYVPQKGEVNWDFPATVLDVVLMGRYVHKGWIKRPNRKDESIALSATRDDEDGGLQKPSDIRAFGRPEAACIHCPRHRPGCRNIHHG